MKLNTCPAVICIYGPTAAGKTALSIELAKQLDGEIISVDSALIYRGMDIGTAKPSLAERQGIPHHLLDICDPAETYSWSSSEMRGLIERFARGALFWSVARCFILKRCWKACRLCQNPIPMFASNCSLNSIRMV